MIKHELFDNMTQLNAYVTKNIHRIHRIVNIQYLVSDKKHLLYYITK